MSAREREAILIVTAVEPMEAAAAELAAKLNLAIDLVATRASALRLLNRRAYLLLVVDETLLDADVEGADLIWKSAGLAVQLPFSFALGGRARLERELRAALARRRHEQQVAELAAAVNLDADVKDAITGLLLQLRLALTEENVAPALATRLRTLEASTERLRVRIQGGGNASKTAADGAAPRP